jgi:nucleoside-diphosphate-sugar epimerase
LPYYTNGVGGYIDVRDVVKAMILLNENPSIKNERFILNSENLSFKDFFSLIAKNLGKNLPRYQITPKMVSFCYPIIKLLGMLSGKGSAISRENLNSAFSKSYYSSEKIKRSVDLQFLQVSESVQFIGRVFRNGSF